jgi:hypothetical protein
MRFIFYFECEQTKAFKIFKKKNNMSRIRKKNFYLKYIVELIDNLTKNQEYARNNKSSNQNLSYPKKLFLIYFGILVFYPGGRELKSSGAVIFFFVFLK